MPAKKMKPSELLSKRGAWCQTWFAKTKDNRHVLPESPSAVKWCAAGAVDRCCPAKQWSEAMLKINALLPPSITITEWNDDPKRTKRQVIRLLEKAGL